MNKKLSLPHSLMYKYLCSKHSGNFFDAKAQDLYLSLRDFYNDLKFFYNRCLLRNNEFPNHRNNSKQVMNDIIENGCSKSISSVQLNKAPLFKIKNMDDIGIIAVSHISTGFGVPQITNLTRSLMRHYSAESIILEPHDFSKPALHHVFPDLKIARIKTKWPPFSYLGRVEYLSRCKKIIDEIKPDVLIIPHYYSLPILLKLKGKPKKTIYYVLECADESDLIGIENRLQLEAKSLIDISIHPEQNRAKKYINDYNYQDTNNLIIYNAPPLNQKIMPPNKRNNKFLYQGTINKNSFAEYYLDKEILQFPIDVYGFFSDNNKKFNEKLKNNRIGKLRYKGWLSNKELNSIRKQYAFSIVMWNPSNFSYFNACPNKFFESIASGVPVITAPHPQTKKLVEKYNCGIVMDGWSIESFQASLVQAMKMLKTKEYAKMVKNCMTAHREELNWETQFKKLEKFL